MAYARRDIRGGAVQTTLTAGITAGAASCAIAASTGWPDGSVGGFYIVIDPGLSTEEKILCSTRSSLTVNFTTRGADGSTASAHASGAVCYPVITAVDIDEANYTTTQTVGKVTAAGDLLVGTSANALARLAKGSNSTVLQVDSGGTQQYGTVTSAMITDGTIVNADISGSAAIAYSKLALTGSIVSGDIVDGTIVNADVNAAAAIAYSKLALTNSIVSGDIVDGTLVNADINAAAAIAYSKLNLAGSVAGTDLVAALPRGSLGYAIKTTNQTGIGTAFTDVVGLSVTVTVGTNRLIRITTAALLVAGSAAVNGALTIREGASTLLAGAADHSALSAAGVATPFFTSVIIAAPSSGSHTYKTSTFMDANADNQLQASSTNPAYILVEDVGAS